MLLHIIDEDAVFPSPATNWPEGVPQVPYDDLTIRQYSEAYRKKRNRLLAETDWCATSDRTMTAEQTAYRQALRDITGQAGFPTNITWPTKP